MSLDSTLVHYGVQVPQHGRAPLPARPVIIYPNPGPRDDTDQRRPLVR